MGHFLYFLEREKEIDRENAEGGAEIEEIYRQTVRDTARGAEIEIYTQAYG